MQKTRALDVVTIMHALLALEKEYLGEGRVWIPQNQEQEKVMEWMVKYRDNLDALKSLKSKASTSAQVLNAYLKENGFDITLDDFNGIGAVSILDMLVKWTVEAQVSKMRVVTGETVPAFEIKAPGFSLWMKEGFSQPLVQFYTESKDSLWLMMEAEEFDSVDMVDFAMRVTLASNVVPLEDYLRVDTVVLPKVDFDVQPDIGFMGGLSTVDKNGADWFIAQAKQQFKFRMNEHGARVKVATAMAAMRGVVIPPAKLSFNRNFYGWFTQAGNWLPLAVFHSYPDSWKEPTGNLEEL